MSCQSEHQFLTSSSADIRTLHTVLQDALKEFKKSTVANAATGSHIFNIRRLFNRATNIYLGSHFEYDQDRVPELNYALRDFTDADWTEEKCTK